MLNKGIELEGTKFIGNVVDKEDDKKSLVEILVHYFSLHLKCGFDEIRLIVFHYHVLF